MTRSTLPTDPDKLRAWQKRSKPIKRSTRLRPVNPERRRKKFARNYGERAGHVREMPCLVGPVGCSGPIQAAHVKARGMGGAGGDRRSLVPLCAMHHHEQEHYGKRRFQERYVIDLATYAQRIAEHFDRLGIA